MPAMDGPHIQPSSPNWRRPTQTLGLLNGSQQNEKIGGVGGGLPSLNFLNVEKIRREAAEYDHKGSPSTGMNALVSPQSIYSGPPPPYSYPSSTTSSVLGLAGYTSPPEPQRRPDDDKEPLPSQQQQQTRQNLPSIHEALGKDPSMLYSGPPPSVSIPAQASYPSAGVSPTTPVPRSHPEPVLSGPPNPYASNQSSFNSDQADRRPHSSLRHGLVSDERPPSARRLSANDPGSQSMHTASPTSPVPPIRPNPHPMQPPQQSSLYSQQPPPSSVQPTYHPISSSEGYSYPPPAKPFSFQPPFPQSSPWRSDGFEIKRAEESREAASKSSPGNGQHYGESVKRHLDIFDLETSLNEVRPIS